MPVLRPTASQWAQFPQKVASGRRKLGAAHARIARYGMWRSTARPINAKSATRAGAQAGAHRMTQWMRPIDRCIGRGESPLGDFGPELEQGILAAPVLRGVGHASRGMGYIGEGMGRLVAFSTAPIRPKQFDADQWSDIGASLGTMVAGGATNIALAIPVGGVIAGLRAATLAPKGGAMLVGGAVVRARYFFQTIARR